MTAPAVPEPTRAQVIRQVFAEHKDQDLNIEYLDAYMRLGVLAVHRAADGRYNVRVDPQLYAFTRKINRRKTP